MDNTQENKTETNTAPMIAKKNLKMKYQQIYSDNGSHKRAGRFKTGRLTGQGLTRKAHWNGKEEVQ